MAARLRWALCAAAGLALVVPGAAQAAKKTVFMGIPPASQKSFEKTGSDVNAFFPKAVTIHRGDTVAFTPVGFHTVDIPAKGGPLPFAAPTGKIVAAANDVAGIPFWFNGQPELGFEKHMTKLNYGKTFVKGATRITSGLPLAPKPKPMNVRFPKAGTFKYYCNIHAGMLGTVKVVGRTAHVPSAKADALRVKQQVAAALAVAKKLPGVTKPPANTVSIGAEGKDGVSYFGFLPEKLTVAVGTTVTFAMPAKSTDVHTATAGPGDAEQATSYIGALAKSFEAPAFDPRAVYPSEAPGTPPAALSPTLHGNGFWNTGALDSTSASPLPSSGAVTFSTPGTYGFVCLIHPFMKGTVTVQ